MLQLYLSLLLIVDKQEAIGLSLLCNEKPLNDPSLQPPEPSCTQVIYAKKKEKKGFLGTRVDLWKEKKTVAACSSKLSIPL